MIITINLSQYKKKEPLTYPFFFLIILKFSFDFSKIRTVLRLKQRNSFKSLCVTEKNPAIIFLRNTAKFRFGVNYEAGKRSYKG